MIIKSKKSLYPGGKSLLLLVVTMLFIALLSGCATDFNAMRTTHALEFSQTLEQKTKDLIPENGRLDLETCIEIALANNLDIRIADIKGRLAGLDRKIAFSYFLPHVDLQYTDLNNDKQQMRKAMTMYVASSDQDITQWVISGQLSVFNPSTWFLYNAYKKGEEIQQLVAERVRQAIRLQVTGLYIACLSHEATEEAIVSAVEQAETLVKEMAALFREGLILKSDLETARLFFASQENRLKENQRLRFESKARLMEAMGLSPLVDITLSGISALFIEEGEISEQILDAMINRLELKISDRRVSLMEGTIKMAIAAFLPKIVLFGNYTNSSDSYLYYENILSYGISGILTLFDGFASIQRYKAAKQEHQQAMIQREQSCLKIMLEVINARNLLDRAKDQKVLLVMERDASVIALREVEAKWREGLVTASDRLSAVSRYTAAEANVNLTDYQYQVAVATMKDVMGLTGKEEKIEETN